MKHRYLLAIRRICAVAFVLALSLLAGIQKSSAESIVTSAGVNSGFYSVGGSLPAYFGVTWSQSSTYSGVDITALLLYTYPLYPTYNSVTAYLTTSVGPGTTATANQIAQATLTLPAYNPPVQPFTLFSDLTLGPGTYYLLAGAPQNVGNSFLGWSGTASPTITSGSGVTNVSFIRALGSGVEPVYVPALPVSTISFVPFLTITGTATPEPSSVALFSIAGFLGLSFVFRNYRLRKNNGI